MGFVLDTVVLSHTIEGMICKEQGHVSLYNAHYYILQRRLTATAVTPRGLENSWLPLRTPFILSHFTYCLAVILLMPEERERKMLKK
jgi:hypothetical protein